MAQAAHMMFIDEPGRFNRLLQEFLDECAKQRRRAS
jgi:hypothetical protein